jgi:hypothetical protein
MPTNESGEEISEEELTGFAERIRKLSPEEIDELWYLCGFIIEGRGNNKAIRNEDIERINESLDSAKNVVWSLLSESRKEDFRKNLEKVEG